MSAFRQILAALCLLVCVAAQAANNSAFVSQTVPTAMVPGQTYAVSVTMQNTGTTTWTAGAFHRLGTQNPQDNTLWTGSTRVMLPGSVAPGANVTFNFNVTAPTTPGTYNFQWKMLQESVEWFGALTTNVVVKVGLNDSAFVSQSVPPVMTPGQVYPVTVTWQNTGGSTWTVAAGHKMGSQNPQDNTTWGMHRVNLPGTTAPGANAAFTWNVTAPTTPGTYNFQWRTAQSGVEWFGALSTNAVVKVGLDNAAFVSQSVPSTMVVGQTYSVSVTMQNTGSTTWAAGTVGLGSQNPQGNTTWGSSKINLASAVAPSAQTTFNFNVTAPSMPGTYNFQWRMVEGSNGWFGAQSTNVAVAVTGNAPDANVHFIHTDHLNTPRLVANTSGQTVWRWDQQEPFGVNVPDENPSSLGVFEFPLRFPGQYFDKETNLHYNYYRDYDPSIGAYKESDLIGLRGGLNTYAYVEANPLDGTDPTGLFKCFYSPSDFNTLNCILISKRDSDRDLYDWRKTGEVILSVQHISKPNYGMQPSYPNRRLPPTQPPVRPDVTTPQYWEITRGYDVFTRMRQNMLTVVEEWLCPDSNMCRPDNVRTRTITCLSDWVATDATRRGMPWTRATLKPVP